MRKAALLLALALAAQSQTLTVQQALSAPFMNQLTAAPAKNRVAWFVDQEGVRNIYVASPTEKAHAITHNTQDDGQDIDGITWSPDAESVAYTHGAGPDGSEHPTAANPAHLQNGIDQRVEIATVSGEVKIIGPGHAPAFSPTGKQLFYLSHGHIMAIDLTGPTARPYQLVEARGTATQLRPSPDGTRLAFTSKRGDHSFIGIFTFAPSTTSEVRHSNPQLGEREESSRHSKPRLVEGQESSRHSAPQLVAVKESSRHSERSEESQRRSQLSGSRALPATDQNRVQSTLFAGSATCTPSTCQGTLTYADTTSGGLKARNVIAPGHDQEEPLRAVGPRYADAPETTTCAPPTCKGTLDYADPGTGLDHDAVWSPDSKRIAFIRESPVATELNLRWMRSGVPWAIRIADATTGQGAPAWTADTGTGSLFHEIEMKNQLLWMADNRLIFPWEKTGWVHLYELKPGDKSARDLTPGEGEVDNAVTDGERVVYSSNQFPAEKSDIDRRHLWSVSTAGDSPHMLTKGAGIESNPALLSDGSIATMQGGVASSLMPVLVGVSNTGQQIALPVASSSPVAPECYIAGTEWHCIGSNTANREEQASLWPSTCHVQGNRWHCFGPLTNSPRGLQALLQPVTPAGLAAPQQIIYTATDGQKIHAQLFLPQGTKPGTKLPAIVFFHGGSRRQMLLGYNPMQYYAQAYEFNQLLANHGYAVLSVNYRSGTGYGMEFRQAQNYGVFGASEYADVKGAALYLAGRPDIDAKRIGAWGGSYGGYLTALALARNSDLFASGVDLHGVHDYAMEMELEKPNSDPTVDAKAMQQTAWKSSPMADLKTWKSPVLLIQGDDDRNVMFSNTVRLAAALRAQGTPVEELIFPDEVHDFLLHKDWVRAYEATLDFFDRTLKPH